jgi:hypothetical protein
MLLLKIRRSARRLKDWDRKEQPYCLDMETSPSSKLMTVAEIFLNFGSLCIFGIHEGFSLRGIPSGMDTIPMDNERDLMLPVMLHHQLCECLGPGYEFSVYFQG